MAAVLVILLVCGVVYALGRVHTASIPVYRLTLRSSDSQNLVTKPRDYGLPVRLQIPKLKIDAAIGSTGLTKTGDMSVPSDIMTVGWYKYGPHPGNTGSAVIAGHLIGRRGEPGVFKGLATLHAGDVFSTLDDKGQTANFIIRETRTYGQEDQPTGVFDTNDKPYLNLITCAGAWDAAKHAYADRLVVFAEKTE